MALFPQKRKRASRTVPLRSASPLKGWLGDTLKDRGLLGRLLMCFLALVAMLCAVQGWKIGFRYRPGDRITLAVTANVDFQILNHLETERKQARAVELVPQIFSHDPKRILGLPSKLRANLGEFLQAESVKSLSAEARSAFRLTASKMSAETPGSVDQEVADSFVSLQRGVRIAAGNTGDQMDALIEEFERLIEQINQTGLALPEDFSRNQISLNQIIRVVPVAPPSQSKDVLPSDVLLTKLLEETGAISRSWPKYQALQILRPHLEHWLLSQVSSASTLSYNNEATLKARREAQANPDNIVHDYYEKGVILATPGQILDEEALTLLQADYDAVQATIKPVEYVLRAGVVFLMLLLLAVLNGFYLVRNDPRLIKSASRLGLFLGFLVLAVVLGRVLWFDTWRAEIIPLMATVMVFAIAYNQKLATITALTLSLIITISTSGDLTQFVVLLSVAVSSVIPLNQVASRSSLIKIGFVSGTLYFLISWGTGVVQSQSIHSIWLDPDLLVSSLRGAGWCLGVGYLVAGSLPFIEPVFGVVTDMSLLELGDVSHPLLQELVRRAPGTYNHSISMATIGETAADHIGANGLLVRVGAYFHDIGKMLKPGYFVENMIAGSESRHDHLAPAMSTLIIIGHVKDGADLARQHHLPESLIDFIEQHHGTTLVEYFYHAATKQADQQPDHKTDAEESSFRYPGPKPQSREAGVMMLADAVESASRTLSDPTPKRIETLVHEISLKRLLDGQYDESSLTLSEIRAVEDSLVKSLIGIYHGRIKYPDQRTA